jgi:hypothetical protein
MERSTMRSRVVGLVAAAALLVSVGIANAADHAAANAKGPVTLADSQLDKVTAGGALDGLTAAANLAAAVNANVAANVAVTASLLNLNAAATAFAGAALTP